MTTMVIWFKSIYIQVDHHHVNYELALGFKILVIFKASVYVQDQYLSQSALQTSSLRNDKG